MKQHHRIGAIAAPLVLAAVLLSGCTTDQLSEQYRSGTTKNYIAGDGSLSEWAPENRGDPVVFSAEIENGSTINSEDFRGQVVVVNFWYAACAPCRAEAPDLEALNQKYSGQGAVFLGINVRDQADTARSFADTYGITYPSIIDTEGKASVAFVGKFAANAVPTTIVLDVEGRPAVRILGQIKSRSILDTLISDAISEGQP